MGDARLAALAAYGVLDTPPERGFDDLVGLARGVCSAPIALVSLVDRDRQWFKARLGFPDCQTDLDRSVCRHVVAERATLVIPDLTADPRTADNPLVTGEPHVRFYAGAPLMMPDGHVLGALCVLDTVVRPAGLSGPERQHLEMLARHAVDLLELRAALQQRDQAIVERAAEERRRDALLALGDATRDCGDTAEMAQAASRIVGEALGAARATYGEIDHDDEVADVAPGWALPGMPPIEGRHALIAYGRVRDELTRGQPLAIEDVSTDPRTADAASYWARLAARGVVATPVLDHGRAVAVLIVHFPKPHAWTNGELAFLRSAADRLEIAMSRMHAERRQAVLNEELSHRLKNTLSVVQAIAAQTLRGAGDREAVAAFGERLVALGSAHDVLLRQSWSAAKLGEVAHAVLATFATDRRVVTEGPDVTVGPRATLSLSLLLHELATNAVKYGALSVPDGHVALGWSVQQQDDVQALKISWVERGGPPAVEPKRQGFGSRIIRMGLVGSGGVELRYGSEGLAVEMSAPLHQLQQA